MSENCNPSNGDATPGKSCIREVSRDDHDRAVVKRTFKYHAPKGNQGVRYEEIRSTARIFAGLIIDLCPASANRTIAIRKLQEAVMFANASIAIDDEEDGVRG
jgi:hypothetical protein